jgi:hypothetical protein
MMMRWQVCEFHEAGEHCYARQAPDAGSGDFVTIDFELDTAYGPTAQDARELGVQVAFAVLTDSTLRPLCPLTLE